MTEIVNIQDIDLKYLKQSHDESVTEFENRVDAYLYNLCVNGPVLFKFDFWSNSDHLDIQALAKLKLMGYAERSGDFYKVTEYGREAFKKKSNRKGSSESSFETTSNNS